MSQTGINTIDTVMVPVGITQFAVGKPLLSDVYLKLHTDKYVQLGKQGHICHFDQLHAIHDKKVNTLFVHQDTLKEFVNLMFRRLEDQSASNVSMDQKFTELVSSVDLVLKQIQFIGLTKENLENLKFVSKYLREFTKQNKEVVELVHRFKNLPGNLTHHSICVSALSTMVGIEMGWNSENMLEKLSLGGLLHDVGLQKLPISVLKKSYDLMSVEEKAIYETHPYIGAQILRNIQGMASEVISIVYEHHENSVGEGYPRKINDAKMHPLSKIVALVDQFTELVMPRTDEEPFKPAQALNYIENIMGQPFNADCHRAFKKIFGTTKIST